MNQPRKIRYVIEPQYAMEGAGVLLRRSIGPSRANPFDPFLLFDHFAFNDPVEGPLRGFPTHPHRGIETVTYMLEGKVRHRDSLGNVDIIGPGDIQWMTAGRGILHEEMPQRGPSGNIYGFQLWVNLPASHKMTAPSYRGVVEADIPTIVKDGAKIRIVAGEVDGVHGPMQELTASPTYLDVELQPGSEFTYPIPQGHTTLAYLFEGQADFGESEDGPGESGPVQAISMISFGDGDHIRVRTSPDSSARFMLIAGAPFREPIFPYGPFVMNTMEEIQQAIVDLRNGTFVT